MSNNKLTIGVLVAIVIAIGGYFYPQVQGAFGTIKDTSYFDYFNAATGGGFQINGTTIFNATTLTTPTAGGTLTLTTSNTATSTAIIGCIQTYATSTATPVYLSLTTSQTASTTFAGTGLGNVMWAFGSCPK
jgi:hypothetical protein